MVKIRNFVDIANPQDIKEEGGKAEEKLENY